MKKNTIIALIISVLALLFCTSAARAEAAITLTLTGEGACAKCVLKETKDCQLTLTMGEKDKGATYYIVQNDVAREFAKGDGKILCKEPRKITVTGTLKAASGGKRELTPTKIELATN